MRGCLHCLGCFAYGTRVPVYHFSRLRERNTDHSDWDITFKGLDCPVFGQRAMVNAKGG